MIIEEWRENPYVYRGKGKVTAEQKEEARKAFKELEKVFGGKITILQ